MLSTTGGQLPFPHEVCVLWATSLGGMSARGFHPAWGLAQGCIFFKAWRSPAESIAPKRPDHGQSVHGEPKFTRDQGYCTQNPTSRVLIALHCCTIGLGRVRVHN